MRLNVVAAAILLAALGGCATSPPLAPEASAQPKNILFFLGDGMGINTLTAARIYAVGEDGDLTLDTLPESAFVKTFSNDAQVTDSAAAMSAYMTGVKVNNDVLSMSGDTLARKDRCANGSAAVTLAELARARGMATGVVTTTRVTDATPAATYAHVCHRGMENDIAAALAASGMDVVLGGGTRAFVDVAQGGTRGDKRDLLAEMKAKGYRLPANTAELKAGGSKAGQPVLGLFAAGDMSYDAVRDPAREPSLPEMTDAAIDVLAQNPKGFFLVVEGGLIDLALHASNAKRALQETVVFDNALKAALAKMRAIDPGLKNTLIVVTSDHDHTLLLNGYSRRTGKTTPAEPGVLGLLYRSDNGKLRLDADGAPFTIIGFGTGENRVQGSRASAPRLTDAIVSADDYRQEAVVRMNKDDETHGGTDVYLGAIGAGAERFHGTIDNTRVFELIKSAAGL